MLPNMALQPTASALLTGILLQFDACRLSRLGSALDRWALFNPMTIVSRQKILHVLFLISVWIKGVAGLLETVTGILGFFITPAALKSLVVSFTAPELSEDPDDWIATNLIRTVQRLSADTTLFAAVYLVVHGLIKLFMAAGMLMGKLWAYPLSLSFLAAFIVYQCYRYTHTHSIALILLTVLDLAVAFLIWLEYLSRKRNQVQPLI